jgi:hypothetical protein
MSPFETPSEQTAVTWTAVFTQTTFAHRPPVRLRRCGERGCSVASILSKRKPHSLLGSQRAKSFLSSPRWLPFAAVIAFVVGAGATENGTSVYPVGIETVLSGLTPNPNGTTLYGYVASYRANELDNSAGQSAVPGFRVDVFATAVKVVHNWNLPVLGGTLNSNIAVPFLRETLDLPIGQFTKSGVGNSSIGVVELGYKKGSWHWLYEGDVLLPGGSYTRGEPLNVGQHNYAAAPVTAFSYLPSEGRWEVSSKIQYIFNSEDMATRYHSGNEFMWEYVAMREVSKRMALGVNGYFYQQTTDDHQNGAVFADGFRGRDFAVGPEFRFKFGPHSGFALKYQRDTLVQNRPRGNALWFQFAVPLSLGHSTQ